MSVTIKLFELDESTLMVRLDREWISTIKEFKIILKRDKGTPINGERIKRQAQKEFTFLYHFCDYRSKFVDYSETERLRESMRNAELPDNFNLFEDPELTAAYNVYLSLQDNAALKYLTELKETMHTGRKVVQKIRVDLENKLTTIDASDFVEVERNGKKISIDPVEQLASRLKIVMGFATELPKQLEVLKALENQVKRELAGAPNLRGDSPKGYNEDAPSTTSSEILRNPLLNVPGTAPKGNDTPKPPTSQNETDGIDWG